jgi:hypothetical protein
VTDGSWELEHMVEQLDPNFGKSGKDQRLVRSPSYTSTNDVFHATCIYVYEGGSKVLETCPGRVRT